MSKQQPVKVENSSHVHYHNAPPAAIATIALWQLRGLLALLAVAMLRTIIAGEWRALLTVDVVAVVGALLGGEWVARKWGGK